MTNRFITILLPTLLVVGVDHLTKYLAWVYLRGFRDTSYFGDLLRLGYHENPGAFLSLGANLPPALRTLIFTGLVSVFLIYLLYFLLTDEKLGVWAIVFGSLMFGGGVGNLIDRIFFENGVIDFLNMGIGNVRTGIFNVADMAIMVGVIGFFIWGRPHDGVEPDEDKVIEHDATH